MKATLSRSVGYIVLLALLILPIFGHLDTLPIRVWDESRQAMNAYEMLHNGNFIVTYFEGFPDMWNTKPPLLVWFQVGLMKMLGVNELAVRLPSAIAAFLTCVTLLVFSLRYLKKFWFGFIAIFILITSQGYISMHGSRTGDYDALLTLFTTLSGLLFFAFCETKNHKHLYLFFLFTALAVLSKSVTGLLFIPALILYSILQKQFIPLLKNKHFYIGLLGATILAGGYYLLRESFNPGYIAAVQKNELGGRYLDVIETHQEGFWFYYNNLLDLRLADWIIFLPCGLLIGFLIRNKKINRLTLFSSLMVITFFLVISIGQTKLEWYDVPMYPFFALLIAIFIFYLFEFLENQKWANETLAINVMPFIFLFFIGMTPYQHIIDKTYKPKEKGKDNEYYEISYFLKDAINGKHDLQNQILLYDGYYAHNLFYVSILQDKGIRISIKDWKILNPEDIAIAYQPEVKKYLKEHYTYEIMSKVGNVVTYKINGKKEPEGN